MSLGSKPLRLSVSRSNRLFGMGNQRLDAHPYGFGLNLVDIRLLLFLIHTLAAAEVMCMSLHRVGQRRSTV